MNSLYKKNFLKISDFNKKEIYNLIRLSIILKKQRKKKKEKKYLKNKKIALIFEQESTRTRCSFEIAAFEQGAYSSYLNTGDMHLQYKESVIDTVKILENLYDAIAYRGINHNIIKMLSESSKIPVWNSLTKKYHPTQILADIMTMKECLPNKKISEIKCAYVGDASNNIANTILEAAIILGFELRLVAPKKFFPNKNILNNYHIKEKKIKIIENIEEGVKDVDFIYTDVWISMGNSKNSLEKKISLLKKYQVNNKMLELTKNNNIKVLHCLPAFHDDTTIIGKKISKKYQFNNGIEITNTVFNNHNKTIFQQSENKLHTIKALMVLTLNNTNIINMN